MGFRKYQKAESYQVEDDKETLEKIRLAKAADEKDLLKKSSSK